MIRAALRGILRNGSCSNPCSNLHVCSRMRSKGSRFTLGVWGLRVCSLDVAQPFATGRVITCRMSFCVAGAILLRRFHKMSCSFRGRHSTLDVSIVILRGRRSTPHSTLHTLPFTLHTLHSTLYTLHSTLYTPHFRLHTLHFTLYTVHPTLYTPHWTLYTPHFALYTPHSSLHTLHFTLHTLHSTLYIPHFTLYTLHFALRTPQSTLQT